MHEGSVVEDAVERNSWGKSRCDRMCRFSNTGGLHRTSGDAPLETPTLQNLAFGQPQAWCHVHKSKSSSSRRTQAAGVAYKYKPHESVRHSTKHRRVLNADRKRHKQIVKLKDVVVGNVTLKKSIQCLSLSYIRNNIVVCDRGDTDLDAIKNTSAVNSIHCL
jgi:hypothetical protein